MIRCAFIHTCEIDSNYDVHYMIIVFYHQFKTLKIVYSMTRDLTSWVNWIPLIRYPLFYLISRYFLFKYTFIYLFIFKAGSLRLETSKGVNSFHLIFYFILAWFIGPDLKLSPRWVDLGPKSPKQWICRGWVGKLGQNELSLEKSSSVQSEEISSYIYPTSLITSLVLDCYSISLLIFPILYSWWVSSLILLILNDLGLPLVDHPSLYLSVCPIGHPFQPLLCVGEANIALFRGLLHINAARKLATEPLMQ